MKVVVNEISQEEESLINDIVGIGNNLISYSKMVKTKLANRLSDHTRKATEKLRIQILEKTATTDG